MLKCFPTAFSIIAHTWQLNANHYVNFLARFLGLVARMPITSLQAHVRSALIVDWHSLQLVLSKPLYDPAIYPTESE